MHPVTPGSVLYYKFAIKVLTGCTGKGSSFHLPDWPLSPVGTWGSASRVGKLMPKSITNPSWTGAAAPLRLEPPRWCCVLVASWSFRVPTLFLGGGGTDVSDSSSDDPGGGTPSHAFRISGILSCSNSRHASKDSAHTNPRVPALCASCMFLRNSALCLAYLAMQ